MHPPASIRTLSLHPCTIPINLRAPKPQVGLSIPTNPFPRLLANLVVDRCGVEQEELMENMAMIARTRPRCGPAPPLPFKVASKGVSEHGGADCHAAPVMPVLSTISTFPRVAIVGLNDNQRSCCSVLVRCLPFRGIQTTKPPAMGPGTMVKQEGMRIVNRRIICHDDRSRFPLRSVAAWAASFFLDGSLLSDSE